MSAVGGGSRPYHSGKAQVSAPSNFRIFAPQITPESKLRILIPNFPPASAVMGSQRVTQPQTLQCMVRMERFPQTYAAS